MAKRQFPAPPKFWTEDAEAVRKAVQTVVNNLLRGKANNTFDVTLEPNVTETELEAGMCTPDSIVVLTPQSASAAAALATTWTEPKAGRVILHHGSSSATDRTFGAAILG